MYIYAAYNAAYKITLFYGNVCILHTLFILTILFLAKPRLVYVYQ